jgi:hypothetical protein
MQVRRNFEIRAATHQPSIVLAAAVPVWLRLPVKVTSVSE